MTDLLNSDNETLRTLITCSTTVLVALISNILVFAVTKINNKTDKKNSISEEQYTKIFAPIHKLIYFNMDTINNDELKYELIEKIISDNYHIVPVNIRNKYISARNLNSAIDFEKSIDIVFRYLSSVLGYSKEKLSQDEIKKAKKIINRKSTFFVHNIYFYITAIITAIILYSVEIYIIVKYDITSYWFVIVYSIICGFVSYIVFRISLRILNKIIK